jgi:hypothetical protein
MDHIEPEIQRVERKWIYSEVATHMPSLAAIYWQGGNEPAAENI